MCSIGEDDFGDEGGVHAMVAEIKISDEVDLSVIPCRKCKQEKVQIKMSHNDGLCEKCFLNYVRHKFRATLGSSKVVRKNSRVLLLADGTPQSMTLLDMVKYGVEDELFKKLHIIIGGVLFIDDLVLSGIDDGERKQLCEDLRKSLEYLNMPLYIISIADKILKPFNTDLEPIPSKSPYLEKFNSIKSLTCQQDYLYQLKRQLIIKTAKELDCLFVFTPEIGIDIAKKLLTNISLGRGAGVALDVGFIDDRVDGIKIIRPIRDLVPLEVENYMSVNNIKAIKLPKFGQSNGEEASIENLTSSFIDNLQDKFPSTVSTVYKTGDRFRVSDHVAGSRCRICQGPLDCFSSDTVFAIEYSKTVCEYADKAFENAVMISEAVNKRLPGSSNDSKASLCYGCRNIIIEGSLDDDDDS